MNDRHDATFSIGPDHPAIPGHFPGRPVVPGVVLLDHVIAAARDAFGLGPLALLPRVKFAAPVMPGQRVAMVLTRIDTARIAFVCSIEGAIAATGELRFGP